ncbi:hypothetical protein BMF89_02165 [Arthrobacter sp. SRS-W-1-2016]|nr:hypothetical protein BMF89_02165 [Arthrobacter sp. SRS-W-1-2016]
MRITASKRGVSASIGAGPFRVTESTTGRTTSTVGIPGTGASYVTTSSNRRSARKPAASASQPTRPQVARQIISDETWRELLAADGTHAALKFQRNFVRAAVARATGKRPSLLHLTLGQATLVLGCVGRSPAKLTAGGRGVPGLEKVGTIAQWTMVGLLVLIATVSSPVGFVLAAGTVGLMFLLRKRRWNRQAWEDRTGSASPVSAAQRIAVPDVPMEAPAGYAEPRRVAIECRAPSAPVTRPYSRSLGEYRVSLAGRNGRTLKSWASTRTARRSKPRSAPVRRRPPSGGAAKLKTFRWNSWPNPITRMTRMPSVFVGGIRSLAISVVKMRSVTRNLSGELLPAGSRRLRRLASGRSTAAIGCKRGSPSRCPSRS